MAWKLTSDETLVLSGAKTAAGGVLFIRWDDVVLVQCNDAADDQADGQAPDADNGGD